MAPLTWRNVDAPNFSGVTASLGVASQLLNNATSGLSDAIDKRRATMRQGASSEAMLAALQFTDAEKLGQALRDGTALGGVDPRMLNTEAFNFLGSRQRDLLNNDAVRLNNAGLGIRNDASQFNLDESRKTANINDSYRANQPAANQRMAEIRTLFDSGDPAQIARGRKLMADSSRLFTSAGYSNDDAMKLMSGNVDAANAGMKFNANVADQQDFYEERYRKQGEKGLLNGLVQNAIDAPDALSQINKMKDLDATTKANLTKQITENKDVYFPAPSPLDTLPTKTQTPSEVLKQYASITPRAQQNAQQSGVPYIGYDNQNAKRNMPISARLTDAMSFLPEMGIEMRVFSGGQKDQASGTGSPRHNDGDAGDVFFYMNGKKLDWSKPGDVPIFKEIVRRAKERGVTGFGAGNGYMQQGSMHIGFGNPGVWGANGKGENAADWLKDAFGSAKQGATPTSIMRDAVVQNGGVATGAALSPAGNTNNLINNTAQVPVQTTPAPQAPQPVQATVDPNLGTAQVAPSTVIPSTDDLKTKELPGGGKAFVDTNGQLFQKSGNDYVQVDNTGMPIGSGAYQPEALKQTAAPVPNPPANQQSKLPTATEVLQNAQTVNNTGIVDNLSNNLRSLESYVMNRTNADNTPAREVERLKGTKEKPGPYANVDQADLTYAIEQIMKRAGVDADVAGQLMEQSPTTAQKGSWWGLIPWNDSTFLSTDQSKKTQIDIERAVGLMDNFRKAGSNKAGSNAPGEGRLATSQKQQLSQGQVQALAQQTVALKERMTRLEVLLQRDPTNQEYLNMYKQAIASLEMIQSLIGTSNQGIQQYGATAVTAQ